MTKKEPTRNEIFRGLFSEDSLTFDQTCRLSNAMKSGYLLTPGESKELNLCYEDWCCRNKKPYLRVRLGRRWTEMKLDLEPAGIGLTEAGYNKIRDIVESHSTEGRVIIGLGYRCRISRIPLSMAEAVAEEILQVTAKFSEP